MPDVQTIEKDGKVYAKIFKADIEAADGIHFLTEDADAIQVGIFERESGYEVAAHRHVARTVDLKHPGEFLWIQRGSAVAQVFDEEWNEIASEEVHAGDCIIFLQGGHGLRMQDDTRILEVKQGPYPGREAEKVFRDAS